MPGIPSGASDSKETSIAPRRCDVMAAHHGSCVQMVAQDGCIKISVTGMNAVGVAMKTVLITAGLSQPGQGATGVFAV